ncbi:MAG TPA: radical SAM protein [Myxococcota bacterium]|nr:radical SAM protein [Myxococcota bacterium]HOA14022.1 radical SAM protein [Myxococcota bacterium]HOD00362.1 radical SAM protein [Myxococcota bacterium]HOH77330.1 radical SAM protein [Myxococcota bacterium]HPV04086.1 radical SAM protein [Myxococcota bacterium]
MKLKKIAIVRVRGSQDVEFAPSALVTALSPVLGLSRIGRLVKAGKGRTYMPAMALPYIAALCGKADAARGIRREYILVDEPEAGFSGWNWDVDMAMFTVSTSNAPATFRVADRARHFGVKVVMGGIHPSVMPEECLAHADSVARGEAETILGRMLDDYDSGTPAPIYDGGHGTTLEGLPVPAWELGVTPLVKGPGRTRRTGKAVPYAQWVVPVQTSRGCRNACAFCSTTRFQGAARRHRPVAEIADEIRTLKANGVIGPDQTVFFTDNNIVSDSDHRNGIRDTRYARSLFLALKPLGITWVGQGEITVGQDPGLVAMMAESGCHTLLVGLETVSPAGLGRLGKASMKSDTYARSLEVLHDHGISNIGCFIMGLDGHGPETFQPTLDFIERHVDIPQVSVLTPYPGTPLFYQLHRDERILCDDWSLYDITHVVIKPDRLNALDLETAYSRMISQIYSPLAIVRRAARYARAGGRDGHALKRAGARFTSVLAPNIVYRTLSTTGRGLSGQIFRGLGATGKNAVSDHASAFQAAS